MSKIFQRGFALVALLLFAGIGEGWSTTIDYGDHLRWSVRFTYAVPEGNEPETSDGTKIHAPAMMQFSRAGNIMQIEVRFLDGEKAEFWQLGRYLMTRGRNGKVRIAVNDVRFPSYPYASPKGFYGMSRIRDGDLQDETKFEDVLCRYYQGAGDPQLEKGPYEAWIDAATNRPMGFRENGVLLVFQYPGGSVSPVLPSDIQTAWDEYAANLKKVGLSP